MTPVPYTITRVVGEVGFSVTLEEKGDKWLGRLGRRITRLWNWLQVDRIL